MPFGITSETDAEVVDAQSTSFTGRDYPSPNRGQVNVDNGSVVLTPPSPRELAIIEQRARAMSVFVRIPLLSYVAFNGKMPVLVRLGAAVLAVLEATQIARDNGYDYSNQEQW